jgi:hypothetical protein
VWYIYQTLLIAVGRAISILWQLYYVATLVHTNKEALIYVILLLVKPFTKDIFQQSIWEKRELSVVPHFKETKTSQLGLQRQPKLTLIVWKALSRSSAIPNTNKRLALMGTSRNI